MALPEYEKRLNQLKGTVLYENNTYATTGTLNDSITNYKRIKVYAISNDNQNVYQELLTKGTNSLTTVFIAGSIASIADGVFYGRTARLILNNKSFTLGRCFAMHIKSSSMVATEVNSFTITKIVGYKY